ncbi:hypothetical protein NKZ03_25780 [Sinorhizobium meliloti]|uniref:hypothetical protein n=2 Tax=Sinorhizobium/Ensifer group TaxID=227292 RepID=UPI003988B092
MLRFPDGMRDRLKEEALKNARSLDHSPFGDDVRGRRARRGSHATARRSSYTRRVLRHD